MDQQPLKQIRSFWQNETPEFSCEEIAHFMHSVIIGMNVLVKQLSIQASLQRMPPKLCGFKSMNKKVVAGDKKNCQTDLNQKALPALRAFVLHGSNWGNYNDLTSHHY